MQRGVADPETSRQDPRLPPRGHLGGGASPSAGRRRGSQSARTGALLGALSRRLPARNQLVSVAAVCVTAVHAWSVVDALDNLPSWLLFLDGWEIAGMVAYAQLFAFVESMLLLSVLILLAAMLPTLFGEAFVAQSTLLVALLIGWALLVYRIPRFALLAVAGLFALTGVWLVILCKLLRRHPSLRGGITQIADRFTVFLYIYLPIVAISAMIVLIRNIR